jgi:uncharacterized surface protein with fasciclin (FAS1) repeats
MKPIFKILAAAALVTTLTACDDDDDTTQTDAADDPAAGNIVEVAAANGSFTTLVAALETAGLDEILADESRDFTVFAPTDEAFAKIDITNLTNDQLEDILLYPVIPDAEIDSTQAAAAAGTTLTTANSDDVGIASKDAGLFINASRVETPDVDASNGVIHVIDTVLLPTTDDPASGTIPDVATTAGNFNTLLGALGATGLDVELADADGKFTVFAPTDDAFAKIDTTGLTTEQIKDILLYHVIFDKEVNAAAATAIAGNTVVMGNMDEMALSLTGTELFANLSGISAPNVDASNGIIHVIDTVLLPPEDAGTPTQTITQLAEASTDFTILAQALQTTGLDDTLNDPSGDFTVFAPKDAAFTTLLNDLGITDAQLLASPDLTKILLKHVLAGSVDSITAFTLNGADVATLNPDGETVKLEIDSGEFTVDGAPVDEFDIRATNGIVHVIDAVITLDP